MNNLTIIKQFEGLRLNAYLCPANVWTIGYGTIQYPDGRYVKSGDRITEEQAEYYLSNYIESKVLPNLEKIPNWNRLSDNQQSALISFAYNLGERFYQSERGFESIKRLLNNPFLWDNKEEVKKIFGLYVKANSKVLKGLVARRQAEANLFLFKENSPMSETQSTLKRMVLYYKGLPQQDEAFEYIENNLNKGILEEALRIYRHQLTKGEIPSSAITINWNNPSSKVSQYFTVGEVTQLDKRRIPNDPKIMANIFEMAQELDKVRTAWGSGIGVTSWYRPLAVNKEVGGATNSQHLTGKAVDIYPLNGDIREFQSWLDEFWKDKALGYGARKGFVHLDLRKGRLRWDY